ncbi:class I SAM-dependent methyltransferase [Amycolatopsis sp. NPDC059027]|uniref:class I SAM-dependent methyltransferase n=1 Tax=unclassified Amycolatopsis TaxID=2618356 RepID=UPI00366F0AB9
MSAEARRRFAVPDRVRWAVALLDPAPDARLLEIGCGPGAAAELVCARLDGGKLTAIDRSATAAARTTARNRQHIEAGRLEVRHGELPRLDLPSGGYDAAFAIDVNLFWVRDPAPELAVLRHVLAPGGTLYIGYGASGPTTGHKVVEPITRALGVNGFTEPEMKQGDAGFALVTRPASP